MPSSTPYPERMTDRLRVACVQMSSRADKAANLQRAEALVARAAATGADVVVLPEKWNAIGDVETLHAAAEPLDGESVVAMSGWARQHGITLVGGSITERRDGRDRLSNTCCVFAPGGELAAVYRKIHLFDVEVGGLVYRESEAEEPGEDAVVVEDVDGWGVGLSVCYDIRFPELYRVLTLAGAELLTVPANFTLATGKDHWHVLLRARAIESQCYVVAAAQWGKHPENRATFGHALIADPWGTVIAEASDRVGFALARIEREFISEVRGRVPALAHRRL
jgi:predicted amidohydrolase